MDKVKTSNWMLIVVVFLLIVIIAAMMTVKQTIAGDQIETKYFGSTK